MFEDDDREKTQTSVFLFFVLILLPALVYANSLPNSFQYDDSYYILGNSYTHSLSGVPHFFLSSRLIHNIPLNGYRPFTMASFALNYVAGGANPVGYHIINVLIHIINTLLVFGMALYLMRMFKASYATYAAFGVAAFFAIHPLNSQPVNYISARPTLLVGGFSLLCVLLYLARYEQGSERKQKFLLAGSVLAYAGALFSKEEAVAVPGILAFIELCRLRPTFDKNWLKRTMYSLLPFFLLTLLYLVYVVYYLKVIQKTPQARGVEENLLTQAKSVMIYLKLMVFPTGLSVDHAVGTSTAVSGPGPLIAVLAVMALLVGSLYFLPSVPLIPLGIWWFFLALVPTSTLVALKLVVNEQRMYFAGVGLLIAAAGGLAPLLSNYEKRADIALRKYAAAALLVVLICFSAATISRNTQWRTPLSLWSDALDKYPESARANTVLAGIYLENDMPESALRLAQKAVELAPDVVETRIALARAYSKMGKQDEALEHARAAVDLNPASSEAQTLLGIVYARLERYGEAKSAWERAVELDSENVQARENLQKLAELRFTGRP